MSTQEIDGVVMAIHEGRVRVDAPATGQAFVIPIDRFPDGVASDGDLVRLRYEGTELQTITPRTP